jgi:hypothetical protein
MSQDLGGAVPRRCPRCGGLMAKPAGSQLYWHADNNHPRCDITNTVDPPLAISTSDEPSLPPGERSKRVRPKR